MKKRHLFLTLTLCFFGVINTYAQVPSYVSTDSLVAWYPFSGNLDDISGNDLHGKGQPTYQLDRLNYSNSALKLSGRSNIQLPASLFNFGYNDSFTLAFWFSHNAGGNARIFSTENTEGNFRIVNTGGAGEYIIAFGGCCANAGYLYDTLASPNTWNHLAFVYLNRRVNLYINGNLKSTFRNLSTEQLNYGQKVAIGSKASNLNSDLWEGEFDDLGIWSRALTSSEVKDLFCPNASINTIISCDPYTWTNGVTYYSSDTTAKDTFVNAAGCDSIVALNLTILSKSSSNTITSCLPYTWTNGVTYSSSDTTAKDTFVNAAGCDSIVTLHFTRINPNIISQPADQSVLPNKVAEFNIEVTQDSGLTFQWQTDLGTGFQTMSNAGQYSGTQSMKLIVSNVTTANDNQKFRCLVLLNGCSDTSELAILSINRAGLTDVKEFKAFNIYPNPTKDFINISVHEKYIGTNYTITSTTGDRLSEGKINNADVAINIQKLAEGVYFIQLGNNIKQSFKIIKH